MKTLIKILTHPVLIVVLFCLLLIDGEKFGGFYLLFIMLSLPGGALHSLLGIAGIALLIAGSYPSKDKKRGSILGLSGAFLMLGSLLRFFTMGSYYYQTFHEFFPLFMLGLFMILIIVFIILNIVRLVKQDGEKNNYILL